MVGEAEGGRLRQEVKFIEKQNMDQFLEEVGTTNAEEHVKKEIDGREIKRTQMAIPPAFSWSPGQSQAFQLSSPCRAVNPRTLC